MVPLNPAFVGREVLNSLLNYMNGDALNVKLGALIGLSEVLLGLKGLSHIHMMQN